MKTSPDASSDLVTHLDESMLLPQLGCPSGTIGVAVGDMLEQSNVAIVEASYDLLDLHANERVVEIGLGNGWHIAAVLDQAAGLHYTGIDLSPTMIAEARSRNAAFICEGQVRLETADVAALPFANGSFDKAIAINATYFWPDLIAGLRQAHRVLRADGVLVIAAITPEAAIDMPFVTYGFAVHDAAALEAACSAAGFHQIGITRYLEPLLDPPQETGQREFYLLRACAA
ncbi:class I SAM-dependent methyltransferase [Paraburkholderia fungorum]|uniref:class I SAM-dependent methyltransferase n=1 Tax=Paraburkholderia fungorum TaxID=134537 RepID=UPI0038B9AA43